MTQLDITIAIVSHLMLLMFFIAAAKKLLAHQSGRHCVLSHCSLRRDLHLGRSAHVMTMKPWYDTLLEQMLKRADKLNEGKTK